MTSKATLTKLGDVLNITSGYAFKSEKFRDTGGLPLVRIRDVKRGYSETYYDGPFDEKYVLGNEDLLVSMDGEFRTAMWEGGKALLNQRVCRLEPDLKKVDKSYLFYFLAPKLKVIEDRTPFVTVKHLSAKSIREITIPLPPLSEQKRIAAILDKADAIRKKRKQAIGLTETFLRSTFLEMFGDPVTNPKGWEKVSIEAVGEVQGGLQVTQKRKNNPIEVPYLRVANIYRDELWLDEVKSIRLTQNELDRVRLKAGDVLIVEGHGNKEEIGRSAVWTGEINPCAHQNHLIRVRLDPEKVLPIYVSNFLNSEGGRRQMFRASRTTSGLNTISTRTVKETKLPIPPFEQQKKYFDLVARCSVIKSKIISSDANNLFNSLVQKAFRGEL